ncbi:MAG TPA: hypothetical protein VNZ45_14120 [Bacteroidia bacterium]|nr:hypothetical protein [Bacteroidia bacterium]
MNKTSTVLLLILAVLGLMAVTKPSDQTCIDQVKDQVNAQIAHSNQNKILKAVEEVAADLAGQYGLRVEDHVIYKSIYLKGSDQQLAIGVFGNVIKTNN